MTQADRALQPSPSGYDPHKCARLEPNIWRQLRIRYSFLRWIPTCQNESQAATRLHNIYNAFPGAEQMTPDYTDAPPEIALAIEQSTIIQEIHNMPQPEITFRHGLCSASIWEQDFDRDGEKLTVRTASAFSAVIWTKTATGKKPVR